MDYLEKFREATVKDVVEKYFDPDMYETKPASQGKVRYVYVLGRQCGYSQDDMKEFGHHHMTNSEIDKLIKDLKRELGEEVDIPYRKQNTIVDKNIFF